MLVVPFFISELMIQILQIILFLEPVTDFNLFNNVIFPVSQN